MERGSGVLLHITSLPSDFGIGDLGPEAYRFVDFLAAAGQRYWQILPLNPTGTYLGNSPYTSYSVFAGNSLLISPKILQQVGLLTQTDLDKVTSISLTKVDYQKVVESKSKLLLRAFESASGRLARDQEFHRFCADNAGWLDDFSLFAALKDEYREVSWDEWPVEIRDRNPEKLSAWRDKLRRRILRSKFLQYVFYKQWLALKDYANQKKIKIIGDIPIYPSMDSSDAWSHPDLFKLDDAKRPLYVAGAPPDYFSKTGQRWGNPVYDWDELEKTQYAWWVSRVKQNLKLCDMVRLDHFRGFVAYWEIPAVEETAINGKWVRGRPDDFFRVLMKEIPKLPLILEDLGHITPDVKEVMERLGFPGMKVLLFAFGYDLPTNPYAPHNYGRNCVVYTGTHDNNTILGWFEKEAGPEDKLRLETYLGREVDPKSISWDVIRLASASVARLCIIPLQDILSLGEEARMNLPSLSSGNWEWRTPAGSFTPELANRLLKLTQIYARV